MTRKRPGLLLVSFVSVFLLGGTICKGSLTPVQNEESGSSPPSSVRLWVTALDDTGHSVRDLQEGDLQLFVDKQPQKITRVSPASSEKLQVGLLLDVSGSDRDTFKELDWPGTLSFFRNILRPGDEAFVALSSANTIRLLANWTGDIAQVESALREASGFLPYGPTSFYDAIHWLCKEKLSSWLGRRALILVSDMLDNASRHRLSEAIESAQRSEVLIYPIMISEPAKPRGLFASYNVDRDQKKVVRQLAMETGGFALFPVLGKDVGSALDRIGELLGGLYAVEFAVPNLTSTEKGHHIEARCARKDVRILYRKQYFSPSG
jgi:VWFA-related protein